MARILADEWLFEELHRRTIVPQDDVAGGGLIDGDRVVFDLAEAAPGRAAREVLDLRLSSELCFSIPR